MSGSTTPNRIPDWVVIGKDHNGSYLANSETGEKTNNRDNAEKMPIHEAVDAKKSGTIQDYEVQK